MTAYKHYDLPASQKGQHIFYGHELNSHEKELLQHVKEKKAKRQKLLEEIRRRRARSSS